MNTDTHNYDGYIERMTRIRRLSSPRMDESDNADTYSHRLQQNFRTIGALAAENRQLLEQALFPILETEDPLTEEEAQSLRELGSRLFSDEVYGMGELDLPIMSLVTERLMADARRKQDIHQLMKQLKLEMYACYGLMYKTLHLYLNPEIAGRYLAKAEAVADILQGCLDHDEFLALEPGERAAILGLLRYMAAFYVPNPGDPAVVAKRLRLLDQMLDVEADPFFREALPDYAWTTFLFRTLEYYQFTSECSNIHGCSDEQLQRIADRAEQFETLLATQGDTYGRISGAQFAHLHCTRSRYLAGRIPPEDYEAVLLSYYGQKDPTDFGMTGCTLNMQVPLEILCYLEGRDRTPEQTALVQEIYQNILTYLYAQPNDESLFGLLDIFADILFHFTEEPGGMTFEDFGLQALAALHPPTYVHSRMVASLSRCLCAHLIDTDPQILIGTLGTATADEVCACREEILSYLYHAALCHDFGKMLIMDTIFVYGRRLLDVEFGIIKTHPEMGGELVRRHASTAGYAPVVLYHHRWYDGTGGYPALQPGETADTSAWQALSAIVQCVDCLDAATDTVGRSYNQGKDLTSFTAELREGSGTRYAPWLLPLFEHPRTRAELEEMLVNERQRIYGETFGLLQGVVTAGTPA